MKYATFTAIIRAIRDRGEALDAVIVEGIEFIAREIIIGKDGAANQFRPLSEACPVYARPIIETARKGCNRLAKGDYDTLELILLSVRENLRGRRLKLNAAQTVNREKAAQAVEDAKVEADAERAARVANYQKAIAAKAPSHKGRGPRAKPEHRAAVVTHPYVLKGLDQEPLELTAEEYAVALKAVNEYREAQQALKAA